jgi:hypothetical protein
LLEALLQTLLDFWWLVLIVLPLGLVMLPVGLVMGEHLTWRQRRMKIFGIFYGLNRRETLWLAAGLLRLLFILVVVVFTQRITGLGFTAFYLALFLLYALLFFSPKRAFLDLVNSAVIYIALVVGSVLIGYFRDVNGDARTLVVYVLLSVFVVLYVAYYYAKGISELMQHKISHIKMTDTVRLLEARVDDPFDESPAYLAGREAAGSSSDAPFESRGTRHDATHEPRGARHA